jgi:anti-sigma regulatory factor (Ser/Thr protein kinase)
MVNTTANAGELDIKCLAARSAAGLVRTLAGARLREWGLMGIAGDVHQVTGELVANAVEAALYREIRVRLTREVRTVLLAVWDSSDVMPVLRPITELSLEDVIPDARALEPRHDAGTRGRGLPIVQALAAECGVTTTEPYGKWVWARVAF